MLETLPQGKAKLASLRVTEILGSKKPKTTGHLAAVVTRTADHDSGEPPTKKPRTLAAKTGSAETGAAEHVLSVAGASATAQEEPGRETGAATAATIGPELFPHESSSDYALLEWLRTHDTEPCCAALCNALWPLP